MAKTTKQGVICIDNSGYDSLDRRKIYVAVPDARSLKLDQIRVIDESGQVYLYPQKYFVPVALPQSIRQAVLDAA